MTLAVTACWNSNFIHVECPYSHIHIHSISTYVIMLFSQGLSMHLLSVLNSFAFLIKPQQLKVEYK